MYDKESNRMVNGKMMQRKKKGRLYSLGGNEPPKRAPRGRLDRLKTVGTFDLGNEMTEMAQHLDEQINSSDRIDGNGATPERIQARRMSANALLAGGGGGGGGAVGYTATESPITVSNEHRLSYTPGACRREIQKSGLAKRMASRDSKHPGGSGTSSPSARRFHTSTQYNQTNVPTQHSADDCLEKTKPFIEHRKSRSSSTSTILSRVDGDPKHFQSGAAYKTKSPIKHLPATNFIKKSDYKTRPMTKTMEINIEKQPIKNVEIISTTALASTSASPSVVKEDHYEIVEETENRAQEKNEKILEKGESVETAVSDKTHTSADESIIPEEIINEECVYKPRKPVLRKSKRIVRTDSELFDEAHFDMNQEGGVQQTTRVQIHNEPCIYDDSLSNTVPDEPQKVNDVEPTPNDNAQQIDVQKDSNDLSETSMVRDPLKSTTTNSSRNISVDEVDTGK